MQLYYISGWMLAATIMHYISLKPRQQAVLDLLDDLKTTRDGPDLPRQAITAHQLVRPDSSAVRSRCIACKRPTWKKHKLCGTRLA